MTNIMKNENNGNKGLVLADTVSKLVQEGDRDFGCGLTNLGISTIGALTSLTTKELYNLPQMRDMFEPLPDKIYLLIEKRVREAGLEFSENTDISEKPIVVLGLSGDAFQKLHYYGKIDWVSELIAKTKSDVAKIIFYAECTARSRSELTEIMDIVNDTLSEITTKLNKHGLSLTQEEIPMFGKLGLSHDESLRAALHSNGEIMVLKRQIKALEIQLAAKEAIHTELKKIVLGDKHARKSSK